MRLKAVMAAVLLAAALLLPGCAGTDRYIYGGEIGQRVGTDDLLVTVNRADRMETVCGKAPSGGMVFYCVNVDVSPINGEKADRKCRFFLRYRSGDIEGFVPARSEDFGFDSYPQNELSAGNLFFEAPEFIDDMRIEYTAEIDGKPAGDTYYVPINHTGFLKDPAPHGLGDFLSIVGLPLSCRDFSMTVNSAVRQKSDIPVNDKKLISVSITFKNKKDTAVRLNAGDFILSYGENGYAYPRPDDSAKLPESIPADRSAGWFLLYELPEDTGELFLDFYEWDDSGSFAIKYTVYLGEI